MVAPPSSRWSGRAVAVVTVTNDGASPVRVQRVFMRSSSRSVVGEYQGAGSLPCSIEPYGGRAVWYFDRQTLRDAAAADGGDQSVSFQAVVASGTKTFKSRDVEEVHPNEPLQQPKHRQSFVSRQRRRWRDWTSPHLIPGMVTRLDSIDLAAGTYELQVHNLGGGLARGATLELLRSRDGSHRRERVGEPTPVGRLFRHKSKTLTVSLQDEAGLFWYVRHRGSVGQGTSAMTRVEAEALVTSHVGGSTSHPASDRRD